MLSTKERRFLQIGLGSMGKRRIRNLLHHKISSEQIFGFDPSRARRKEAEGKYGIKTYKDFKSAIKEVSPDVYIIGTPPDKHHEYFLHAAKNKKHFFVEATTVDTGYKELQKYLSKTFVAAPSCTFRYFPAVKEIKNLIQKGDVGRVLSFQYHLGQYLPDWHPWEDYRKVYFSQKNTGACREMFPFELTWLTDAFAGDVRDVCGATGHVSSLDMPADDIYAGILRFKSGIVGAVVIDVLARSPFRTLRVIGDDGVLEWEWMAHAVRVYRSKTKKWKTYKMKTNEREPGYVTTEDMYREEIGHFLGAIAGRKPYPYTFKDDQKILNTLFALEKSSKAGKTMQIKN